VARPVVPASVSIASVPDASPGPSEAWDRAPAEAITGRVRVRFPARAAARGTVWMVPQWTHRQTPPAKASSMLKRAWHEEQMISIIVLGPYGLIIPQKRAGASTLKQPDGFAPPPASSNSIDGAREGMVTQTLTGGC
jgi:hypothetical protein